MKEQNLKYYLAGGVALMTFIVYLASLQNSFVFWDDEYYVFENPYILSLDVSFFKWAFFDFYVANWHPLTWISHALDYAVWGLNPLGHHLTNNILHAVNTFLVVVLVARLLEAARSEDKPPLPLLNQQKAGRSRQGGELVGTYSSPPIVGGVADGRGGKWLNERAILLTAAVTGLLFGLHPVHVESVAWVAERKDLLCALFYLLSIMMYTKYAVSQPPLPPFLRGNRSTAFRQVFNKYYLLSLAFFTLALLSKPMAVSLPVVLLILDWYPFHRITSFKTLRTAFFAKLPFIALSVVSSVLTVLAQASAGAIRSVEIMPLSTRMLVALKSLVAYLLHIVMPVNLLFYYPYPTDASLLSAEYLVALVFACGTTAASFIALRKTRLWFSLWAYYVITLIPVLGLVQVGSQAMADRYTYLPGLAPSLLVGLAAAWVLDRIRKYGPNIIRMASVITIAVIVSLSYMTFKQIGLWKDSITLWSSIIDKIPEKSFFAYNNRGRSFIAAGQFDKAIDDYRMAIALRPGYALTHSNLGTALLKKGLTDEAIGELQIAIRLESDLGSARKNLADAFYKTGRIAEALEEYLIVTRLRPDDAGAHADLGSAYGAMGSYDKAIEHFQTALRLRPDFADAHYNLGIAYQAKGMMDQAVGELEAAARLSPADAAIRNALAEVYGRKNSPAKP